MLYKPFSCQVIFLRRFVSELQIVLSHDWLLDTPESDFRGCAYRAIYAIG